MTDTMDTNIIVDTREPASMYKGIMEHKELQPEYEKLDYGDYIVGDYIIERKTCGDFIGSVLDKRLWNQIIGLGTMTGKKPALLIEGSWGYTLKDIIFNYNQVFGIMNSITIDYGTPIIRTSSQKKTIEYFTRLVKHDKLSSNIHSVREKGLKNKSLSYQQQFVLEGLPGIGATKAVKLLKEGKRLIWILENMFMYPSTRHIYYLIELEKLIGKKTAETLSTLLHHDFNESEL